ncbi:MAG: hypothetical protein Q8Q88_23890 [Phenylobacterium sp.]|uniref:hypothetical protein n=1 Tax=Phenylobacterium sp. TaxID=1871053 RepID=UPI002735EDE1|nr:hypothetical protein [Phenylobacterium sp.]MDP3750078.1 hypothetical protein [Phenylobacterium sp.]
MLFKSIQNIGNCPFLMGACAAGLLCAVGEPAFAQSAEARAMREFRQGQVRIIEDFLFSKTQKTTQVIFLKRYDLDGKSARFCGEGMFGSARKTFIVGIGPEQFALSPTQDAWRAQCSAPATDTMLDLR